MGIRAKLVLCLLAVLIPLVAVSIFAMNLFDRQLTERTEAALGSSLRLEAARINEILATYAQDARNLASGTHVRKFVDATNAYRLANRSRTPGPSLASGDTDIVGGFDGFAIVDLEAAWPLQQLALAVQRKAGVVGSAVVELRIVDSAGGILGESIGFTWEPADVDLLKRSMQTVKTLFGDAFVNDQGQQRLGMISPVVSISGELVGALMLETRLDPVTDLVSKHEGVGRSSEAHIAQPTADGHAQFITPLRFDRKSAFAKIVSTSRDLPINQALDAQGGRVIHALDYRGVQSILAIETIPATGWGLVVKIDTAEAYQPVVKLRSVLTVSVVLSILFVLAGYMFCLVPIAQRIKRTALAANKIMKGDLTTRVNDDNPDEIGHLARTIDTLARDLEADQLKRLEVEARLRHQALHDELTGLLNRKHANSIIGELNADRNISHSVMFLDLNGFKDVNDLYGHAAGDQVLVTIAGRLAVEVGPAATLARWGGDEFVIILPECGKSEATEFAARVHNAFDDPVVTSKGVHHLSCSVGLATSSRTKSLDDALMEADIQMYEQKKRQQQRHSKGSLAARTVERALLEDRIEVWYQPVVRYRRPGNYELAGAEAMVRVCSGEGGVILPEEFLRDVNASELGTDLDRQVLTHALSSLARWNAAGIVRPDFRLSVNLTAQSLTDPTFSAILSHQMDASGIRGEQIVLMCPREPRVDAELLRQLRALNVGLSLCRIGTEPTGLPKPSVHRPDLARINGQWLSDKVLAPHIMAICTQLNLEVIIEGIETREQMAALHDTGATLFQGNLFDRPLRAVDFVSRWGESSLQGMGEKFSRTLALRLAV